MEGRGGEGCAVQGEYRVALEARCRRLAVPPLRWRKPSSLPLRLAARERSELFFVLCCVCIRVCVLMHIHVRVHTSELPLRLAARERSVFT
jgi:hypothetical protein